MNWWPFKKSGKETSDKELLNPKNEKGGNSKMAKTKDESDVLFGMKSICKYLDGISEATVLKFQREYDLPIKKMGGIWQGSKAKINTWSKKQAA